MRKIRKMEICVNRSMDALRAKQKLIDEQSNRDREREALETKMRQIRQLKKSEAIIKFEQVMSGMCTKVLQRGTIKTLADITRPLFNKGYETLLDQLSSYYVTELAVPDQTS